MAKTIHTDKAPAAIGPYVQGKIVGNLLFASGQVPLSPETGEIIGETIQEQTEQVLKNVGAILAEAGTDFDLSLIHISGKLLLHLMDKIASLPRQTIDMLLTFSDNLLFESELVIRDAIKGKTNSLSKEYIMLEESGIVLRRDVYKRQMIALPLSRSAIIRLRMYSMAPTSRPRVG